MSARPATGWSHRSPGPVRGPHRRGRRRPAPTATVAAQPCATSATTGNTTCADGSRSGRYGSRVAVLDSIVSQIMSLPGQLTPAAPVDPPGIVVGSFDLAAGRAFPPHIHHEHQLVWASSGVLEVTTPDAGWILPPTR